MDETRRVVVVVEDEPDVRMLIRLTLTADPRIELNGEASSAPEAIELARTSHPELIILDHQIEREVMGLDAAPLLKEVAPTTKILLFTAFDLQTEAGASPFIDAFLSKKDFGNLLAISQGLLGLEPRHDAPTELASRL